MTAMSEAPARFSWGQSVRALVDLHNDGSYPDCAADALLAAAGAIGEVVQVGSQVDSGAAVYLVEFAPGRVVGCLEPELMAFER
jgi:nitrogen fixation protein NifZ